MRNLILSEIIYSKLMVRHGFSKELELFLNSNKEITEKKTKLSLSVKGATLVENDSNIFSSLEKDSVVIVPIIGTMFKYDNWWNYGCDFYADVIRMANASDNVSGIIILMNTPGGSTQSLIQLEDALRNRTKPAITLIDGMACSCGTYIASLTDKIVAMNRMCEIGSIGVFVRIMDDSKYYEDMGIKLIEVYPPESSYKNKGERDLIEKGDPKWIIDESLSPFAQHFQNIIRENRNIDESVEGILEGRVFYAYDAINNGLIDSIMNLDEAVKLVRNLAEDKRQMVSLFNS